jgi:flotillin
LEITNIAIIVALGVLLLGLVSFIINRYRTVGPEEALIITGSALGGGSSVVKGDEGRRIKIISGGGTFVFPVIQQAQTLPLTTYNLEVVAKEVYTVEKLRLGATSNAVVKVGSTLAMIATAAENFLGKSEDEKRAEITVILDGHLRSIIGAMEIDKAYSDKEAFALEVKRVAAPDLEKLGFEIKSFNVKDFIDADRYFESKSRHRIAEVHKDAEIAESEARTESRIKRAEDEQKAKKAELERSSETAEAEKENQIKMAGYRQEQDQSKARADAAYDLQKAISAREVKEQEMEIEIIERKKQTELAEREAERVKVQYQSEINLKADAHAYELGKQAEAQKIKSNLEADAQKYQIEAQAEADAMKVRIAGQAEADAQKLRGQAEAEVISLKGKAEAEVILETGLAEAKAQTEKAKAFEKYGEAAKLEMVLKMMPEYASAISAPMSNVESIKIIDSGSGQGVAGLSGSVTGMITSLTENLKETVGIDVVDLLNNYSGKHNLKGELGSIAQSLTNPVTPEQPVVAPQPTTVEVEVVKEDPTTE